MRVLLTTDTVGGVWVFAQELTRELLRRGHAVALVSFGRSPSPVQTHWVDAQREMFDASFRYTACNAPLEWMRDNTHAYLDGQKLLLHLADDFAPDILHTSQFCFGHLPITTPKLITAHSDVLSWADACRPDGLEDSAWLQTYKQLVGEGLGGADAVIAPTAWMLKALRKHFRFDAPASVIPNGRTLPALDTNAPERKLQAISVGRLWDEAKDIGLLLHITSPLPIVCAGEQSFDGAGPYMPSSHVQWLGALTEPGLLDRFLQSSAYIVTSKYEPFGLAPLEAALCGCAVVARDLPSLRETWGEAALYFRDAAELEHLLHHLRAAPATLEKARTAAHARAVQLTAERMTDRYLALYSQLIAAHPNTHHAEQDLIAHA